MAQTLLLSHSSRQQHVLQPPIIFINGLPGIGKFTIAKELAVLLGGLKKVRVVNHRYYNDLVDSLLPAGISRQNFREKIVNLLLTRHGFSPETDEYAYVFTGIETFTAEGTLVGRELRSSARLRHSTFVPIMLRCADLKEHLRRMNCDERVQRMQEPDKFPHGVQEFEKWTKLARLFDFKLEGEIEENLLELDVGKLSLTEAAQLMADHVRRLVQLDLDRLLSKKEQTDAFMKGVRNSI